MKGKDIMPSAPITFVGLTIEKHPEHGKIFMTSFPGLEIAVDGESYIHPIEMDDVLNTLAENSVKMIVILTSSSELPPNAMCELLQVTEKLEIEVVNLPVQDFSIPDEEGEALWIDLRTRVHTILSQGSSISLSCLSGKGRSGTFAARVLHETGMDPTEAINFVRSNEADAIETAEQESWVGKELFARVLCKGKGKGK
ncbi:protein-tyrosine phosphatase family protein [Vibrio sp. WJH972]